MLSSGTSITYGLVRLPRLVAQKAGERNSGLRGRESPCTTAESQLVALGTYGIPRNSCEKQVYGTKGASLLSLAPCPCYHGRLSLSPFHRPPDGVICTELYIYSFMHTHTNIIYMFVCMKVCLYASVHI